MTKSNWSPPRSPIPLIQELFFPDEWKILVSCVMLNCTSRKQIEKVIWNFFGRWPTPEALLSADINEVKMMIKPLGFSERRTNNLLRLADEYLHTQWIHASELHGIGVYAARAWEIFCQGIIGTEAPKDHALTYYYELFKDHEAFKSDSR